MVNVQQFRTRKAPAPFAGKLLDEAGEQSTLQPITQTCAAYKQNKALPVPAVPFPMLAAGSNPVVLLQESVAQRI